jgi:hypothetical protein
MGKGLCLGLVAALILSFHRAGIRHSGRSVFWVALTEPAFLFRPGMKAVHHGLIAVSVAAIILTSCNQDSGISDQQISDYIKTQIPFFISQALYATASQSSSHECQADRRARK